MRARTDEMIGQYNKLFLIGVCAACIIGIVIVAILQILSVSDPAERIARIPYGGYLFSVFILGALWSVYKLGHNRTSQESGSRSAIRIAFASFGVAGVFYFLAYAVSLVCCGVEGVRFVNANIFSFFAVGVVLSLPLVLKRLR